MYRRLSTIWEEMTVPMMEKKEAFSSTQSWDDFLDFSRMRIPVKCVVTKRLFDSIWRFSGNYCGIWIFLTLTWGIILKWRHVGLIAIVVSCAFAGKVVYVNAHVLHATASERLASYNQRDVQLPASSKVRFHHEDLIFRSLFETAHFNSIMLDVFPTFYYICNVFNANSL